MILELDNFHIQYTESSLGFVVFIQNQNDTVIWKQKSDFTPVFMTDLGQIPFLSAKNVEHTYFQNGVGRGIQSRFEAFTVSGQVCDICFETRIWVEYATRILRMEWIPIREEGIKIKKVLWPGPFEFCEPKKSWYTVYSHRQGVLLPNTWKIPVKTPCFDGRFGSAGSYMSWYGQVKDREGYLAICETPTNAGIYLEHSEEKSSTQIGIWWEADLGSMRNRRILRYQFFHDCDYNDLCKCFRSYVDETGKLRTLSEKSARNPKVNDLIGCCFIHKGIKTNVQPESDFYDPVNLYKNHSLTTFATRAEEIQNLKELGVEKAYLHLDGWAKEGYDNCHPDILPICEEAGGWDGMKALIQTVHDCGFLFGIHDQYRDFYQKADSFDLEYACLSPDGSILQHARWGGGPQAYLCTTQAPFYVKRNFEELRNHGVQLDAAYLDVFTCNEADECDHPQHRMSRKESQELRSCCFEYLNSRRILTSSEEVTDWAVPSLLFCHYAPYEFMLKRPGSPKEGIPVPLFNLVFHDCMIIPWMMDKTGTEDYMLYALLNGGAPYLIREGAYPDFDGAFSPDTEISLKEQIKRCRIVSELHQKVAKCEMVFHRLLDTEGLIQQTLFDNGTQITINLKENIYKIEELL